MTIHDERWTLGVAENGDVRLRDVKTGGALLFAGRRALFDALGVLADWREFVPDKGNYGVCPTHDLYLTPDGSCLGCDKAGHRFHGHDGAPCLFPIGIGTSGYCDRPESDPVHDPETVPGRYVDPEGGSNNVAPVPNCGAPGPCYLSDCVRDASGVCMFPKGDRR